MALLPDHPDKFDKDWLANKLGQPAGSLKGWTTNPVGTGQVGDSYRLTFDWADAAFGPATAIAKCPASDPKSRDTGRMLHNYEVEVRWYQQFASDVAIRTPHCYFADIDENITDFVLLMEDVAPAEQGDQLAGGSSEQVKLALSEIAHLHSFRWNDPTLAEIDWLNYSKANLEFIRSFVPNCYPEWRARYQGRIDENILEMGAELIARFESYVADRSRPLVIVHSDLRLDNILFTDAHGRAIIVDWQTISAGAPMGDVAYCIGTSFADPQIRAREEEKLFAHYLSCLSDDGVRDYESERAWQDYCLAAFSGFTMGVIAAMLVERTERGDEMFAVMAERSGYQALHLDSLALL